MPALKVHVRPPHKHKGLMILCALYGVCCGVAFAGFTRIIEGLNFGPSVGLAIFLVLMFMAPLLGAAMYLARYCQHKGPVYLAGQVAGTCYCAGIILTLFMIEGATPRDTPWWAYVLMAGVAVGNGVMAGLINLLFRTVCFNGISVLKEQDGTLCVICGYCVVHSPSDYCPECGTLKSVPVRPLGLPFRFGAHLDKHARLLGYGAAGVAVVVVSVLIWHSIPVWRFAARFETADSVVQNSFHRAALGSYELVQNALDIGNSIENDPQGRVLIIQQYRRSTFEGPLLQVRIGCVVSMPGGGTRTFRYLLDGVPRVLCELDERETDHAMAGGIPGSLVEALVKAADDAGWMPTSPAAPVQPKPDVVVSADGHFPEFEKGAQ